jgi:LmbE family N-acetylglucosaminyl deacetylase
MSRPVLHSRPPLLVFVAVLVLTFLAAAAGRRAVVAQVRPVYDRGLAGLLQRLERLQTVGSLLHTGAHPDDEDSSLLARLARGDHARVAYLSLTRGEGGQNVIGPELFDALGVIRTEELLQARALDGADQFFTRAVDFGFSKTLDETKRFWNEEEVLGDVVRIIRAYRPLVIAARFSGTPADGHGHHQFAGYITPIAYRAAADPARFPDQIAEGLRPWKARKLYVGLGFRSDPAAVETVRIETGRFDSTLGRTYFQVAMEGRSQHKSQQMGMLELMGNQVSGLRLLDGAPSGASGPETSVFDGLDTTLTGIPSLAGLPQGALGNELSSADRAADRALAEFDPRRPGAIAPVLAEGLSAVRAARAALRTVTASEDARAEADFLLAHEEKEFADALQTAAGVMVETLADAETLAPGESVMVAVNAFTTGDVPVRLAPSKLGAPAGWRVEPAAEPQPRGAPGGFRFREMPDRAEYFRLVVPADATPTRPYWLASPRAGALYRWPDDAPKSRPFAPAVASSRVEAEIAGVTVSLESPLQYRYADDVRGELRRNLNVVPALGVELEPDLEIVSTRGLAGPKRLAVRLANYAQTPRAGTVRLVAPDGWRVEPSEAPFDLSARGARAAVTFQVVPPPGTAAGAYTIKAEARADGHSHDLAVQTVAYPHIQTHRLYRAAETTVRVIDVQVMPVRVGYVMGSGDQVPEAIKRLGLDVTLLGEEELASGDLARFDTIVIGVRASETRPDFVANMGRLHGYVRDGGTLIVQYQQPDFLARSLAPFPGEMASRVTDETAPVRILQPGHPLFTFPNKITPDDWSGWVQERNLYAFTTFDERYVPLLETADPGEPPQRGGELYAQIGRGRFVYTSYAWFRQLPAGVPGAYRLFANLLSLAKAR